MIKRIIKIIGSMGIGVVLLSLLWIITRFIYFHDFDSSNTMQLMSPYGLVSIYLDENEIPHIKSSTSDVATAYGLGYIHAKHRLWQMELQRHVVSGRLSEIFGYTTIKFDQYLRTWGFYHVAQQDWTSFDSRTKQTIMSYTEGVNAYLARRKLPLELILLHHQPEPWTTTDAYAWQKMLAWQLQNAWQTKLNNLLLLNKYGEGVVKDIETNYPDNAPIILSQIDMKLSKIRLSSTQGTNLNSYSQENDVSLARDLSLKTKELSAHLNIKNVPGKGSNNWVVSGKFTKSGLPLLANDVHLELSAPSMWYLAEMKGPTLHVKGATIPGVFCVIIGHNDHLAWGMTDAGLDVQDIYRVDDTTQATIRMETIKVRWGNDLNFPCKSYHGNPIISQAIKSTPKLSHAFSIKWPALMGHDTTAQSLLKINYATNWKDFTDALKDYIAPSQNFIYADIENNIGYYLPGRIPIRNAKNLRYPVEHHQQYEWQGYVPFDQLPHVYNPPEGFIASANNRAVDKYYPYMLTQTWKGDPYRIIRIREVLENRHDLAVSDMKKMQMDTMCVLWRDLQPFIMATIPKDNLSKQALSLLRNWDGDISLNSQAATIFSAWFNELAKMQPSLPIEYSSYPKPLFIVQQLQTNGKYCQSNNIHNCAEFLSMTLQKTTQKLASTLGSDPHRWQWYRIHLAQFNSAMFGKIPLISRLWHRTVETSGGPYTINVGTYDANLNQIAGATYRQIIDLGSLQNSVYIYSLGQSENPFSKHYDDFLKAWQQGQYIDY